MNKYGYVRVSTRDQNPERQIVAMEEKGISVQNIFIDKTTGKDFNRKEYRKLLEQLEKGDLFVVKSIDRLGRNYGEILEEWRKITKNIGANIQVLDFPLLNTDVECDTLTGKLITDLVLQILAYVAETERAFIKQRQAEGIALAKKRGTHLITKWYSFLRHQQIQIAFRIYVVAATISFWPEMMKGFITVGTFHIPRRIPIPL